MRYSFLWKSDPAAAILLPTRFLKTFTGACKGKMKGGNDLTFFGPENFGCFEKTQKTVF